MIEEAQELLKQPLERPLDARLQVETCKQWREAEKRLTEAKGRLFDPSLGSEDKRRLDLAYKVRDQQFEADSWRDVVAIMKQQVELGRPLK